MAGGRTVLSAMNQGRRTASPFPSAGRKAGGGREELLQPNLHCIYISVLLITNTFKGAGKQGFA